MDESILELAQQRLGYAFRDPNLLQLALTHASVADSRVHSNERMEFLGDAVLGLIVCQRIYELFPQLLEGEMTKIKSTVVSRAACAAMARQVGLIDCLWLGKGMRVHEVLPQSLAAAVLEAVIAAIYFDASTAEGRPGAGLERTREFVLPLVEPLIERAFASGHQENFKSILQQHAQQHLHDTPQYVILEQKGPDHAKHFHVCVQIGERQFPSSWGQSKKTAEQQAALLALYELGITAVDEDGHVRVVANGEEKPLNGSGHANGNPLPTGESPKGAGNGAHPAGTPNSDEHSGGSDRLG